MTDSVRHMVFAVVGVVALGGSTFVVSGSSAAKAETQPTTDYWSDATANNAAADLGEQLQTALASSPDFAGTVIEPSGLEIRYVGSASAAQEAKTQAVSTTPRLANVATAFMPATYSFAQLMDTMSVINAAEAGGSKLSYWAPDVETNRVVIHMTSYDPSGAAELEKQFGPMVSVATDSVTFSDSVDRTTDSSPWWGGDKIYSSETCTSWFSATNSDNGNALNLTAGHCGSGTWYEANGTEMATLGNQRIHWVTGGTADAEDMTVPSNDHYVWDDPDSPGSMDVNSQDNSVPPGNTLVCTDGEADREVCGVQDITVYGTVTYNGKTIYDQTQARGPSPAFTPGDSGGPVYRRRSDGVQAEGMIVAHQDDNNAVGWYTPVHFVLLQYQNDGKNISIKRS